MYQMIGTYSGDLKALLEAARKLPMDRESQGYSSTSNEHAKVEQVMRPLLSGLFPGKWPYAMVVAVHPNGMLPPHEDTVLTAGVERYHIVLQTNPLAWCMHDGDWQQLEHGGIYTMVCQQVHAAVNWGIEDRIHLVVDTGG